MLINAVILLTACMIDRSIEFGTFVVWKAIWFWALPTLPKNGCTVQALPVELTRLPLLERLYLDNNKLSVLPPELGELKNLKVLRVDGNMLVSVPGMVESLSYLICSYLFSSRHVQIIEQYQTSGYVEV